MDDEMFDAQGEEGETGLYMNHYQIPFSIAACPLLSLRGKMIISYICRSSKKYEKNGGCSLSNPRLAEIFEVKPNAIADAIATADKLGWIISKETKTVRFPNGSYKTIRKIIMATTEEWEVFGILHGNARFGRDKEAGQCMEELKALLKNGEGGNLREIAKDFAIEIVENERAGTNKEALHRLLEEYTPPIKNNIPPLLKTLRLDSNCSYRNIEKKKTICSGKNPERLDHSENDSDGSLGVVPRKRKPPTKTITMEVEDLTEKNEQYLPYVQRLAQIVFSAPGAARSKQRVQLDARRSNQWANEIRLLCEKDAVTFDALNEVLDWYAENNGGEYIPEVESASALRKKWPRLLSAIKRGNKPGKKPGGIKQLLGGAAAIPGKYDDVKTIVVDNTKF